MYRLTIIRGLPGSGKTTYAKDKLKAKVIHEADDWFMGPTGYQFSLNELHKAHEFCKLNTEYDLKHGFNVTVCNTFTRAWEFNNYRNLFLMYPTRVIELHTQFESIHNVPKETIEHMKNRWENQETIEKELRFHFDSWEIIK